MSLSAALDVTGGTALAPNDHAVRRLLDVVLAAIGLVLAAPIVGLAALGIRVASPGPAFYRARRAGRHGAPFTMYKLRTMHLAPASASSRITAREDRRVFPLGRWLRRAKIDEVPQFWNVLRGEMAIIGPRPEDPEIVTRHYAPIHHETLRVKPGLASPGSLYQITHGDALLDGPDPETAYARRLLPFKLALDVAYVRRASLGTDLRLIARTIWIVVARLAGRRRFPEPPEAAAARLLMRPVTQTGRPA